MSTSKPTQEYATPPVTTATKLRRFLNKSHDIVVAPGVYDGFSARIALQVGFDALYMVCYSASTLLRDSPRWPLDLYALTPKF